MWCRPTTSRLPGWSSTAALVEQLERLDPQFPTLGADDLKAVHEARKMLTDESP